MKLICSPKFLEDDIKAIEKGYKNKNEVIKNSIIREIDKFPDDIFDDNLNCLSWLIANNRLEIRVAIPININYDGYGIYHEKIGIFYDQDDNSIIFYGSNNETLRGVTYNYESFDVYKSWIENERCKLKEIHFNKLWENKAKGVKIFNFPEAAKKRIIEKIIPQKFDKINGNNLYIFETAKMNSTTFIDNLWYFQNEAINNWEKNSFNGIFSMATGTGKTKTAIGSIIRLKEQIKNIFAIIVCPQNTILKQWEAEIERIRLFNYSVVADSSNNKWQRDLANLVIEYNEKIINDCIVYTIYNTLSNKNFIKIINELIRPSMLVCDEVHWAGAKTFSRGLLPIFNYRLGLSATPTRYMDEEGTDEINEFFGKVVYEFSLERALREINPITQKTFLCPYNYYPKFVSLNENELFEYSEISKKISNQYAKESKKEVKSDYFQRLCEKRQEIVVNASAKYEAFDKLIDIEPIEYLLIYCSPNQIDKVQEMLNKKCIKNHRFTGDEEKIPKVEYNNMSERDYILLNFENKNYDALVAMKCLDEGINILRAETGIFMASSGNPKQFIQRRGRLLRRHEEKKMAKIYDICVVPYLDKNKAKNSSDTERHILEKELKRYEEFANLADNSVEAMNILFKIKDMYNFIW